MKEKKRDKIREELWTFELGAFLATVITLFFTIFVIAHPDIKINFHDLLAFISITSSLNAALFLGLGTTMKNIFSVIRQDEDAGGNRED